MKKMLLTLILTINTVTLFAQQEIPIGSQCYCSIKCGPREVTADDAPFYDEEYGVCFCRPRDKAFYSQCEAFKNTEFSNSACDIVEEQ